MVAGSKRRAWASCFSLLICYTTRSRYQNENKFGSRFVHNFGTCKKNATAQWRPLIKKCVGPQNSSELAIAQWHVFASTEIVHRPRWDSLYMLIFVTYDRFARKNQMEVLCAFFPQPCCPNFGMFAASTSRLHCYRPIGSFPTTNSMRCLVTWLPLRICFIREMPNPTWDKSAMTLKHKVVFTSEFAICSWYQDVEENEI